MGERIKKAQPGYWITLVLATVPFTYMILFTELGVALSTIHRSVGVLAAALLAPMIWQREEFSRKPRQVKWMLVSIGIFFGLTIFGQLFNFQHLAYYYSGLRNNSRYFIFFFACILFLKAEERDRYYKVIDGLFWLNFLVTLYQYFVMGLKWDYLGGIYGVTIGCSSDTNLILIVTITASVIGYMNGREKAWMCLAKCVAALIISALAEIRVFFVEFAAIVAMAILMAKFSRRMFYLLIGTVVGIVVGVRLLYYIFPQWNNWFNWESMKYYVTASGGYMGIGDVNRLTAVPILWNTFLETVPQKLFGLGLGNCDFGLSGALTPDFYNDYFNLNYTLFSSGFIMLENGLVGFIAYIGFFLTMFFGAHTLEKSGKGDPVYCQMGKVFALMCLVLFVYDCTLRTECGFLLYFVCALPFLGSGKEAIE